MVTLALNTASKRVSIALINEDGTIFETSWQSKNDESEKLLQILEKLLQKAKVTWKNAKRIIVVRGPGPFSATRIGVITAAMLAKTLGIRLYSIDTPTLWRLRAGYPDFILISAGGSNIVVYNKKKNPEMVALNSFASKLQKLSSIRTKTIYFTGELTDEQRAIFAQKKKENWHWLEGEHLANFGFIINTIANKQLRAHRTYTVFPEYLRPPNITKPKYVL